MRLIRSFIVVAAALAAGCASSGPGRRAGSGPSRVEAAAMAQRAGMSADEISRAGDLYALKCARCHRFYNPAEYGDAEWSDWMTKMGRKARLRSDEHQLLAAYLGALRVKPTDAPTPAQ